MSNYNTKGKKNFFMLCYYFWMSGFYYIFVQDFSSENGAKCFLRNMVLLLKIKPILILNLNFSLDTDTKITFSDVGWERYLKSHILLVITSNFNVHAYAYTYIAMISKILIFSWKINHGTYDKTV